MQVGDLPVYIAGDVTGERPILHEAGDEGKIAGASPPPFAARRRSTSTSATPTSAPWESALRSSTGQRPRSARSTSPRWAGP
jgi:hypothetical protein